ncbi:MAG TPA: hypothetical protein VKB93_11575 [Thermoanaerobaculia bacterium]|nr:hypothetical protein [Thermoanaerobaculia bacterium]
MNALSSRRWYVLLGVLIAVVYALVAVEAARCEFLLVNDYIAFTMIRIGAWPSSILQSLFDVSAPGAGLFRPFPDVMAYVFASLFRAHSGAWHVVLVVVRLVSVGLAFRIAQESSTSKAAAAAGAAYFAFFPAFPEIDLLRAENWLLPALAATFLGWLRLRRDAGARRWWIVPAFLIATTSKEIAAPLCAVLFVLLAPHFWRRGNLARAALALMLLALVNQIARCALMLADPYARGSGSLLARLPLSAFWNAKVWLLVATSFPLLSLILLVLMIAGVRRLPLGAAILLVVSIGMSVAAPYPAIRYAYPAALFLVPCIAAGVDALRPRLAVVMAATAIVLLAIFGGANLIAQAAAMRASTRADWQLLNQLAAAFASGRDVVVLEDPDFERSFWMRAELVGVDPRWPFLSYVGRQYADEKPVVWPASPGAVNLTGLVPANPTARFILTRNPAVSGDAIVVAANPIPGIDRSAFTRFARMLNPRFHYAVDLGHSPYPGHHWTRVR